MCYHYQADGIDLSVIADAYRVSMGIHRNLLPLVYYYPLSQVPVIRAHPTGDRELTTMEWGLLPGWWKPSPKSRSRKAFQRKCYNARCETAHEKPSYRSAFKKRHCLLPARAFFEHGRWFHLPEYQPFAFAGLWERWETDGETVESCTLLTTVANRIVAEVHPKKRMPVMLVGEAAYAQWLRSDLPERGSLECLFESYHPDFMEYREGSAGELV
jgi:putative SOS response-associated peptidase YedK